MQSNLLLRHCLSLWEERSGRDRALAWGSEAVGLSLALPLGSVLLGQITSPPGLILFLCKLRQILELKAFRVIERLRRIRDAKVLAKCQGFSVCVDYQGEKLGHFLCK